MPCRSTTVDQPVVQITLTRRARQRQDGPSAGQLDQVEKASLAEEVIRGPTDFNGFERAPMRIAEAQITLGVAAAREGDLEGAVILGRQALSNGRKSLPSLAMVSQDLAVVLSNRFAGESEADAYLEQLREIRHET